MDLTAKQKRFVAEYLLDLNATQAAIRSGYSASTADKQGPRLLSHPEVKAAIDAAKIERSIELKVDASFVLRRLVDEVEADLADLYTEKGDLKPVDEWPEIWRQGLVSGLEVEALFEGVGENRRQIGFVKKIKLSDRLRRIELIGKHVAVNAFQETVNVAGVEALADRIARAKARAAEQSKIIDQEASEATDADADDEQPPDVTEAARPRAFAAMPKPEPKPPEPPPKPPEPYRPIVPAAAPWPPSFKPASVDYDPLSE